MLRATRLAISCALGVAAPACHPPAAARRPPGNVGGNVGGKATPDDVLGLGGAATLRFAERSHSISTNCGSLLRMSVA